jgi:hypothetical protein
MSKKKRKRKKIPRVKAVGISVYDPIVLVTFGTYSSNPDDSVFIYPKKDESDLVVEAPKEGIKNYMILKTIGRALDLRPFADHIYRLIVLGRPAELEEYGIPVIDTEIKDGRIHKPLTLTAADLQKRIEENAVVLKLKKTGVVGPPPSEEEVPEEPIVDDDSLLGFLFSLKDKFSGDKLQFENQVTIPTIFRLIREINRDEFKLVCRKLKKWGIEKEDRRAFYRYVEGIDGTGGALGKAARRFLWPKKKTKKVSLNRLAARYEVNEKDLKFVILGTQKLQDSLD